jgi:chromosome segregation ATPase
MDGNEEVITVLKEIRDEAKQTNARLDQTNARLDQTNARLDQTNARLGSLEGRFEFLEHRVSKGFERVERKFGELETQLVPEIVSTAGVIRQIRDLLEHKLDDHAMLIDHERRIQTIEGRDVPRNP